jgi:hypothetical protein
MLTTLIARTPEIAFPNGVFIDLGVVEEGEVVNHGVIFENNGKKPLKIVNGKTSCGCTGISFEKRVLAPGESSRINVSYTGRPIHRREETLKVWIESNDPKHPISVLTLVCKIHLKVFWYPRSISFYIQGDSGSQNKEIRFSTDNTDAFKVDKIVTSSDRIQASWEKDDKGGKCVVALAPRCPAGTWTDKVTINILVGDYERSITIPVYLMIK